MMTAFVELVAMVGPGLAGWREGAAILSDPETYVPAEVVLDNTGAMTANERRRTTPVIRLALQVLEQLSTQSSLAPSAATSVFATSWGDYQVIANVLSALTMPGVPVSPVHFHNIVHNTPAGYWSIGSGARGLSTSLSAADATLAAGLMEAFVCLSDADAPVLFVGYDHPLPPILDQFHAIEAPFAVAMMLSARRTKACRCALHLEIVPEQPLTRMAHADLERLRTGNPAARALPLLQAIALRARHRVILPSTIRGSCLAVDIVPVHDQERDNDTETSDEVSSATATVDAVA